MEDRHENTSKGARLPSWYDGKKIDEVQFCSDFLGRHPMKCVRGRLFTVDGAVEDEGEVSRMILEEVSGCLSSGISKAVTNLLAALKLTAYSPPLPIETDRIYVANGTYFLNGSFTEDKAWCNNRLKVRYEPNAPKPERWLGFLSELLEPEDIPTLQEYLGYCLIPSTKGQKMLLLIGKGGEGKSRIGLVMRSLLGDSMNMTSIQKVENNRFSRADLENKLLMVDDDMDMAALPKTNYIKSIVTAECKMDLERKGVQSYQSRLYARFLCFGNGALTALHDRSDGFFRRQIVLTTRDRPGGAGGRPLPRREAGGRGGGHLSLVPGRSEPAAREQLPVQSQRQGAGKRRDSEAQQQQRHRVPALRGLHPLQGRRRGQLTGALRGLQALVRGQRAQAALGKPAQLGAGAERGALQGGGHEQHLRRREAGAGLCGHRGAGKALVSQAVNGKALYVLYGTYGACSFQYTEWRYFNAEAAVCDTAFC